MGTITRSFANLITASGPSAIADGTIVNADISASAAIDSTKLSGVNDAKAFVNFDGTGTVAIRASFNVSSITDNGTGDYTVNFTTAISDANYAVAGMTYNSGNDIRVISQKGTQVAGSRRVIVMQPNNFDPFDSDQISVVIFR